MAVAHARPGELYPDDHRVPSIDRLPAATSVSHCATGGQSLVETRKGPTFHGRLFTLAGRISPLSGFIVLPTHPLLHHYSLSGVTFAFGGAISSWRPALAMTARRICFCGPEFLGCLPHLVYPSTATRRTSPKALYKPFFLGRGASRRRRGPAAVLSPPRPALLSNVSARLCYVYARSHSPRLQKQWASVASPPSVCTCCLTQSGPVLSVSYTSESIRRPSGSYNISCLFPLPPFHYLLSCSAGPPLGYLV